MNKLTKEVGSMVVAPAIAFGLFYAADAFNLLPNSRNTEKLSEITLDNSQLLDRYQSEFILFYSSSCPACKRVLSFLKQNSLNDRVALIELSDKSGDDFPTTGAEAIPALITPEKTVVGFSNSVWSSLSFELGYLPN